METVSKAVERGLYCFNITQNDSDDLTHLREEDRFGVIECGDMLLPAVYAKVSKLLGCGKVGSGEKGVSVQEMQGMVRECSKGDISIDNNMFQGREGGIVHYFEDMMIDSKGLDIRTIVDKWLLQNIFFSCVKKRKVEYIREIIEFSADVVCMKDHENNSVFHVLPLCEEPEEVLSILLGCIKDEEKLLQLLNGLNVFDQSPIMVAIKSRKRR